jgi:hypothetical protein
MLAQVERKTVVGLLQLIEAERSGETVDRVLIAHLLRCFTSLGIYTTTFQAPFLQQTTEFYAAEGLQYMATTEVAEYLLHCEVKTTKPAPVPVFWQCVQLHWQSQGTQWSLDGRASHGHQNTYVAVPLISALFRALLNLIFTRTEL